MNMMMMMIMMMMMGAASRQGGEGSGDPQLQAQSVQTEVVLGCLASVVSVYTHQ